MNMPFARTVRQRLEAETGIPFERLMQLRRHAAAEAAAHAGCLSPRECAYLTALWHRQARVWDNPHAC